MVKRRIRAFALFALVIGCMVAYGSHARTAATLGADKLEFTAKTLDGSEFSGRSLAGKPAVLWFWAPWCPACNSEAPAVARVAKAHPEVEFVGVAARDELPAMKRFVAKYQMDGLTQLADLDGAVWRQFSVVQQPAFAFLKADGSLQVVGSYLEEPDLNQLFDAVAGH